MHFNQGFGAYILGHQRFGVFILGCQEALPGNKYSGTLSEIAIIYC